MGGDLDGIHGRDKARAGSGVAPQPPSLDLGTIDENGIALYIFVVGSR